MGLIKVSASSCVVIKFLLVCKAIVKLRWWSWLLQLLFSILNNSEHPCVFYRIMIHTLFWVCESYIFKTLLGLVWFVILLFCWLTGSNYDFLKAPFLHKYGICPSTGMWYGSITSVKLEKTFLKIKKRNVSTFTTLNMTVFLQDYSLLKITRK